MSLLIQVLFMLCAVSLPSHVQAVEQELEFQDDGGGGGYVDPGEGPGGYNPGGSSNNGASNPGSSSNNPGSGGSGPVQVACLSDGGDIRNASAGEVCKAVLPKCTELKKSVQEKVKDMMSQKIWGYYNGKDVDLARSTATNLVGNDMPYAVCSVVGHKLKGSGTDAEIKAQTIGKRASCGIRPRVEASRSGRKFALKYDGQNGSMWIAYMLGAYPWLIRKHSAAVLNGLQNDLGNLEATLSASKAMNQDLSKINQQMRDYAKSLSAEAKTACDKPNSNLIADCVSGALSINDPAQRACTIVKSQLAANEGALPYMLAFEIMQRVQKEYDSVFSKVINFKNPTMSNLVGTCADTSGFLRSRKKKLSMTASCLFGGDFCTTDDGTVREKPAPGVCGGKNTRVNIQNGSTGGFNTNPSRNVGFAAVIEKLIRHDICGQNRLTDDTACDSIDIPSKPKSVP